MKRSVLLAILCLLALSVPAHSQYYGMFAYQPRLTSDQLDECIETLQFQTEGEKAVIRDLYSAWVEEYHRLGEQARARAREAEEARNAYKAAHPDSDGWPPDGDDFGWFKGVYAWRATRRDLEASFANDVLAVLKPDQKPVWIRFTRQLRRERLLPEIRLQGRIRASADLIALVGNLELTKEESRAVEETMDEYATVLDGALGEWQRRTDPLLIRFRTLGLGRLKNDTAELTKQIDETWQEFQRFARAVSDVNTVHSDLIAAQLSEENRKRFVHEAECIEFPEFCRPSPVDLVVDRLRTMRQLDEQQRQSIEALYSAYLSEQERIRPELLRAVRQWNNPSDTETARRTAIYQKAIAEGGDRYGARRDHPAIPWLARRHASAKTTSQAIRAVLTTEQFESMPVAVRMLLSW